MDLIRPHLGLCGTTVALGLATRTSGRSPEPDVEAAPPLARPVGLLADAVGRGERGGPLAGGDAARLAEVLPFLADRGWQPPRTGRWRLSRLWEPLADRVDDERTRRRLLIAALEGAETSADADRLLARLDGREAGR